MPTIDESRRPAPAPASASASDSRDRAIRFHNLLAAGRVTLADAGARDAGDRATVLIRFLATAAWLGRGLLQSHGRVPLVGGRPVVGVVHNADASGHSRLARLAGEWPSDSMGIGERTPASGAVRGGLRGSSRMVSHVGLSERARAGRGLGIVAGWRFAQGTSAMRVDRDDRPGYRLVLRRGAQAAEWVARVVAPRSAVRAAHLLGLLERR
jgi:hypothetical protein